MAAVAALVPVLVVGSTAGADPLPIARVSISGGSYHVCAVTSTSGAQCWGQNDFGQLGNGATTSATTPNPTPSNVSGLTSDVAAVAAGGLHSCALNTGGGVKCWGQGGQGQLGVGAVASSYVSPTPVDVVGLSSGVAQLDAGSGFACAVTTGGAVKCWGRGSSGQIGNGSTANAMTPVDVTGLGAGVTSVSASAGGHACAVTGAGAVWCWGRNSNGELGNATLTESSVPVAVTGLTDAVSVTTGQDHSCALTSAGAVRCWGDNSEGQLGNGNAADASVPVAVAGLPTVASLTAGTWSSCGLESSGGVWCWGSNLPSIGGTGTYADALTPVRNPDLPADVVAVSSGARNLCALTSDGAARCWGFATNGVSGPGAVERSRVPIGNASFTSQEPFVTGAQGHTCVLSGGVRCWGAGLKDTRTPGGWSYAPRPINGLPVGGSSVSTSSGHACAVVTGAAAWCWGESGFGKLGNGSTAATSSAVPVTGLGSGVSRVSVGFSHSCALTTAGGVKCWGANTDGQLGNGTFTSSSTPVDVTGMTSGVAWLDAGDRFTCAATTAGAVKCWGDASSQQLGNPSVTDSNLPVTVTGLTSGYSQVSAGGAHACALGTGGGVKCWGSYGLGATGSTASAAPVTPTGLTTGVKSVSAGSNHTCAATTANAVKCWGENGDEGKLGNDSASPSTSPVNVVGLTSGVGQVMAATNSSCAVKFTGALVCWGYNGNADLGINPGWFPAVVPGTFHGPLQISASRSSAPNAAGWHNSAVTVSFTCTGGSSPVSCPSPVVVGEGADQSVTRAATDAGGATRSATVADIDVDLTAPSLAGAAAGSPNAAGWYKSAVSVPWACSDTLSGLAAPCPAPATLTGEGIAVTASTSIGDLAGNTTGVTSAPVRIDRTAPTTTASAVPTWAASDVTVDLSAGDNLSGVAATNYTVDGGSTQAGLHPTISGEGSHELTFWSSDVAGNDEVPTTITVRIDATAPTIAAALDPEPNGAGWNTGDVTVTFTCEDGTSGVASCTAPATVTTEGTTSVDGLATDHAGNSAGTASIVHLDRTAPTITTSITPAPYAPGHYSGPVTVTFTCNDALSGTTGCPAARTVSAAGPTTVAGDTADAAGNTASTSVDVVIDLVIVESDTDPAVIGQPVILRGTTTVAPGGTMAFHDGPILLGTKTVYGGAASFTTAKLTVGSHAITVSYKRTAASTPIVSPALTQVVGQGASTVAVTSSAAPSVAGQAVKLEATVARTAPATGTPTGSVTFFDGATSLGTVVVKSGVARLSVKPSVGSHPISAVYGGSGTFTGSTSPTFDQVVGQAATTTVLTSTANPSVTGQSVTVKATVKAVAPGSGAPTGTVDFFDNGTFVATRTITSGYASLSALKPTVGEHRYTAIYSGSGNSLPSTAGELVQTVNRAATKVTVTSPYPTTTNGHSGNITATLAALSPGSGTVTGTVVFYDDGAYLATVVTTTTRATISIASLPAGVHHLTASFAGNGSYAPSTSPAFTQTIQ